MILIMPASQFTMDHRGQGASERIFENSQKGYVENFDHFIDDAAYFVQKKVLPEKKSGIPFFQYPTQWGSGFISS